MWIYKQSTGSLTDPSGKSWGFGFSGQQSGLNNPLMQGAKSIGPLPQGDYTMTAWEDHDDHLGYGVIILTPVDPTKMFGRSAFRIHGPVDWNTSGIAKFLTSSEGCIIYGNTSSRKTIWNSTDKILRVTP